MYLCICVFVYLYLANEGVMVSELVENVISFQKIFGLCGLKCHIVEIWRHVPFVVEAVFVYLCICVFVYLCICNYVFGCQTLVVLTDTLRPLPLLLALLLPA